MRPHDVGQGLDVEIGVAELLHPAHQLAKRGKINERMKEGASKPVPHDEVSAGRPQQVIYRRGRQRHVTKILRDNLLTVRVALHEEREVERRAGVIQRQTLLYGGGEVTCEHCVIQRARRIVGGLPEDRVDPASEHLGQGGFDPLGDAALSVVSDGALSGGIPELEVHPRFALVLVGRPVQGDGPATRHHILQSRYHLRPLAERHPNVFPGLDVKRDHRHHEGDVLRAQQVRDRSQLLGLGERIDILDADDRRALWGVVLVEDVMQDVGEGQVAVGRSGVRERIVRDHPPVPAPDDVWERRAGRFSHREDGGPLRVHDAERGELGIALLEPGAAVDNGARASRLFTKVGPPEPPTRIVAPRQLVETAIQPAHRLPGRPDVL